MKLSTEWTGWLDQDVTINLVNADKIYARLQETNLCGVRIYFDGTEAQWFIPWHRIARIELGLV